MSQYPDAPGHRNVETSIAAADDLAPRLGQLQRIAHEAVLAAGDVGRTSEELAIQFGVERWSVRPRTSELRRKGLIKDSGTRRPNATGKMAIVWVAK